MKCMRGVFIGVTVGVVSAIGGKGTVAEGLGLFSPCCEREE